MTLPFRLPGTIYKLANRGLAVDTIADPEVDQVKMTAAAVICTPAVDRQNEIILPDGGDYADYARNPVVLWEHGFDPSISFPIAASDSEEGELQLSASAEQIEATSRFTTKSVESYQIFGLIVDKIIRATSIHVIPDETAQKIIGGESITVYPKWRMLEWSWGSIGVNPEAVARVLSHGKIGNESICESLAKSLRPFAARPSRSQVRVGAADQEQDMKVNQGETKEQYTARCLPELKKSGKSDADAQAEVAKLWDAHAKTLPPGGGVKKTDPPPAEQPATEKEVPTDPPPAEEEESSDEMPSVRVAKAVYASLQTLMDNLEGASNTYEDPRAKEYLGGAFKEQCGAMMEEVKGLISELGGEAKESEPDEAATEEEAVKTWLASAPRKGLRLSGYIAPLNRLSKAKNLTEEQRMSIQAVLKSVRGVIDGAKVEAGSVSDKALQTQIAAAATNFGDAAKGLQEANAKLAELIPAN